MPDLAEAVGAKQFNNQGALVDAKKTVVELRRELFALKGDDFWSRFGRWFVMARPGARSALTPGPACWYIERCIEQDSGESLDEAEKLAAGNAELVRRLLLRDRPDSRAWPYRCDSAGCRQYV